MLNLVTKLSIIKVILFLLIDMTNINKQIFLIGKMKKDKTELRSYIMNI